MLRLLDACRARSRQPQAARRQRQVPFTRSHPSHVLASHVLASQRLFQRLRLLLAYDNIFSRRNPSCCPHMQRQVQRMRALKIASRELSCSVGEFGGLLWFWSPHCVRLMYGDLSAQVRRPRLPTAPCRGRRPRRTITQRVYTTPSSSSSPCAPASWIASAWRGEDWSAHVRYQHEAFTSTSSAPQNQSLSDSQ